ncbi:MAG: hypothetical protein ACFCU8_20005 [Thermosynechococcaceae cyanobacterium]
MQNQFARTATQSSSSQLDLDIAQLYQHFLAGEMGSLEFSELLDELISVDALINGALEKEAVEEVEFCQAA